MSREVPLRLVETRIYIFLSPGPSHRKQYRWGILSPDEVGAMRRLDLREGILH
jgi:hypothetical protein